MANYRFTVHELWCGAPGARIYGKLYLPEGVERPRLIIFAHEVGCTHSTAQPYAEHLASRGYAFYAPDFRGGGVHSRSDGSTLNMSVMTEVDDLNTVIDETRGWDMVDTSGLILMGASQGGLVAAICAAQRPELASALMLIYPVFGIPDAMKKEDFHSREEVPEKYFLKGWLWIGRRYALDIWDYDSFAATERYKGPVLMIHGDADEIVDTSQYERVRYANMHLHILPGAGHMFRGKYAEQAKALMDEFLDKYAPAEG